MLLPSIFYTICECLQKTFNFVNTNKPCRKKAKPCEKILSGYVARFEIFVDYY